MTRESSKSDLREPSDGPVATKACLLILALGLAVLVLHAWSYLPFFEDDSFISLRYAQRFIQGKGLTWNDGEHVEGYSNLLWVLLLSGSGKAGVDLVLAARVLGVTLMGWALAALLYAYPPRKGQRRSIWPGLIGVLMLACSGPLAIWGIGGLEQPLLVALLAWAIVLILPLFDGAEVSRRRLIISGLLLGLAMLTRPDAPLFVVTMVACLLILRRFSRSAWRSVLILAGIPLVFYLGQLAFRLWYYGDWVPNTAYVKVALSATRFKDGILYNLQGLLGLSPLVLLAVLGAAGDFHARRPGRATLLISLSLVWMAYVCFIGGDVFGGYRHLVVVVWMLALLAASGVAWLGRRLMREFRLATVALFVAVALLLGQQLIDIGNRTTRHELWEWGAKACSETFKNLWPNRRPLMAVDAAGAFPYYTEYPCIDMLGLNDRHIAKARPDTIGQGWVGHELGDAAYVMSRQPDIMLFGTLNRIMEPSFPSGRQMLAMSEFHRLYQPVMFYSPMPGGRPDEQVVWLRREDSPVGITRQPNRIVVPAYFFGPASTIRRDIREVFSPAVPSASPIYSRGLCVEYQGHYGTPVDPDQPGILVDLPIPPGAWRLRTDPPYREINIVVRPADGSDALAYGQGQCFLKLEKETVVDVHLDHSLKEALLVEGLVLEKVGQ